MVHSGLLRSAWVCTIYCGPPGSAVVCWGLQGSYWGLEGSAVARSGLLRSAWVGTVYSALLKVC